MKARCWIAPGYPAEFAKRVPPELNRTRLSHRRRNGWAACQGICLRQMGIPVAGDRGILIGRVWLAQLRRPLSMTRRRS